MGSKKPREIDGHCSPAKLPRFPELKGPLITPQQRQPQGMLNPGVRLSATGPRVCCLGETLFAEHRTDSWYQLHHCQKYDVGGGSPRPA